MALNSPSFPPPTLPKNRFLEEQTKKSYTNLSRFYFVIFCYYFFNFLNFSSFLTRMGESGILWPVAS